jgi:hypothetical protein
MTTSKDSFSIDIVLRHPSHSPDSKTEALSIKPQMSHAAGKVSRGSRVQRTCFYACLQRGDGSSDYEGALTKVNLFIEKNGAFWTDFLGGHGEVDLILNHTIYPQEVEEDLCFELYLDPTFLRGLSTRGIGLRVQGWRGSVKAKECALPPGRASLG